MREIWTVFRFTLRDGIRKKAFIITTAIVLVLILAACMIPSLMGGGGGEAPEPPPSTAEPAEKTSVCYLLDRTGGLPGLRQALEAANRKVDFQVIGAEDLDARKAEVGQSKTTSIVEIAPGETLPSVTVYVTDILSGISADGVADVVKTLYVSDLLSKAGLPEETASLALAPLEPQTVMLGKMDMTGYVLGIVLTMIVFFAVYYYGYGVAMSVAAEKTSRVMETLIVSAKPSRILLGKCLGMGVLGLFQMGLFLLVGGAGFALLVPEDFTIMGMPLALSSFTVPSARLCAVCDAEFGLRCDGQPGRGSQLRHDADGAHQRDLLLRGVHGDVPAGRGAQADRDLHPVHLPLRHALPAAQRHSAGCGYRDICRAASGCDRVGCGGIRPDLFGVGAALWPTPEAKRAVQAPHLMI